MRGTCSRLQEESNGYLYRVWCGAHQLDLVVKAAFQQLCFETFISQLTGVTNHLRRQTNLQIEMQTTCPTYATTR